ncbi:hypothetical protein A9Q84_11725 [Halobacteriovorax marinus]|uniref:Laminin G domain-containing protein n=1 Tax=Halobacteriovorax marinus TaxID=97084 RepID=A0A1Y5F7W6_9BACT|nr:hypothetical protein A9Q84_11725 [Halobacteriovorax marinus]
MKFTKTILLFLLLLLISSCEEGDELIITVTENSDSVDISVVNPEDVTHIVDRKLFLKKFKVKDPLYLENFETRFEHFSNGKEYFFDVISGKCFNKYGESTRGISNSLECNVPDTVDSENHNFSKYDFFGADARSANLDNVDVSLYDMLFAEVKMDQQTLLKDDKSPFYKMFQNHKKIFFQQKKSSNSFTKKLSKAFLKKKRLKKQFKKAKNDKSRLKITLIIEQVNKSIRLMKLNHKIARKKSSRHLKELKWISKVDEMYERKDRFISRNRSSYIYDGSSAHKTIASNELIGNARFSISLWFKTDLNQGDKRLFNLHRGSQPGSALNLSLKTDRVVMGVHDGTRYVSNELNFSYDDDLWHHFAVVKSNNKITLYLDGERRLEYSGSFSGLGSYPAVFGSYDGRGYFFQGELDEVSLWSKDLNKKDISAIFNYGEATDLKIHSKVPYLKNWWRMGDHKRDSEISLFDMVSKKIATSLK